MRPSSHSRVFSSATRSSTLLETIAGVPQRQVAKRPNRLSSSSFFLSFSQASTIMAEAITMTQTRKSGIFTGVLHSYHSVSKKSNWFNSVHEHSRVDACRFTHFMTMITHAQTACHHVFCLFKAYLRSCSLLHGCGLLASPGS